MMRKVLALPSVLLLASAVAATDLSSSESKRLSDATNVVREFKGAPDQGIPERLWSRAECVTVIPDLKKIAFIVGGEYGKGVMSCRSGQTWSAPIFVELQKGSAGFQIGAEQVDLVLLNRADPLLLKKITERCALVYGPERRLHELKMYAFKRYQDQSVERHRRERMRN